MRSGIGRAYSPLLLPEGDLPAGRRLDDAAPARRALARAEQDGAAEPLRAVGRLPDPLDLDVRQPERVLGAALDDPAAERAAHLKRLVCALAGANLLPPPAEQLGIEGACARQVACVQLEVDDGIPHGWVHRPGDGPKLIAGSNLPWR